MIIFCLIVTIHFSEYKSPSKKNCSVFSPCVTENFVKTYFTIVQTELTDHPEFLKVINGN